MTPMSNLLGTVDHDTNFWLKKQRILEWISSSDIHVRTTRNAKAVRTLCTFATSYPGHFVPLQGTKWLWTLHTLDSSYFLTRHFVPRTKSGFLHRLWLFCALWWLWNQSKSNQLLLFWWDQWAILTIAWFCDSKIWYEDLLLWRTLKTLISHL